MDLLRFTCPGCGRILKARHEMAGRSVACPNCRKEMKVPSLEREVVRNMSPDLPAPPAGALPPPILAAPPPVPGMSTVPPGAMPAMPFAATPLTLPRVAASVDGDSVACPTCHASLRLTPAAKGPLVRGGGCGRDFMVGPADRPPAGSPPVPARATLEGGTILFDDASQWCVVADSISPSAVREAARGGKGATLSASIEAGKGGVRLLVRPWPRSHLVLSLLLLLLRSAFAFLGLVAGLFLLIALPLLAFVGIFAGDIATVMQLPFAWAETLVGAFRNGLTMFQCLWESGKLIYSFATAQPYAFIPIGVHVRDGVIADLKRESITQVLRLSFTPLLLGAVAPRKKSGCAGVIGGFILLPLIVPWIMLRLVQRYSSHLRGMKTHDVFALVIGQPMDLSGTNAASSARGTQREERTVFLVTVNSTQAEAVGEALGRAAGRAPVTLNDEALKRLWGKA
jgi:hypothetical protein